VSARPSCHPDLQRYAETGEAVLGEPFRGITTDGVVEPRLFSLESTGHDLLRQHHARFDHARADHHH
jgi:hypothetical protein